MGGRRIPHDLRLELYRRTIELHSNGVSYRKIQRILRDEYGVWLSRSNISGWVRGLHSPLNEPYNHVDKSKEAELAWIAGMYAGDGSIRVNRKGRFLSLKVKDRDLAEEAAKKLAAVMRRDRPYAVDRLSDGRYCVQVQSRELVDTLLDRQRLLDLLREKPVEFIQAFFDCEGYASGSVSSQGMFFATVGATNTDRDLLEEIGERLATLGISSSIYLEYPKGRVIVTSKGTSVARKDCYLLEVATSASKIRFYEKVNFSIKRKREKLQDIVYILREFGVGKRAAIEWIQMYEYRVGAGRRRWFKRRHPLGLEEAEEEYRKFLARRCKSNLKSSAL